jgi:hypothetical protein
MSLDLSEVRRAAREERLGEVYHNEQSRVVSFVFAGEEAVRVNVYWTTGTVGTCLDHPRQGKTQLFRRNVSMQQLRQIFGHPRVHTGAGYHRRDASCAGGGGGFDWVPKGHNNYKRDREGDARRSHGASADPLGEEADARAALDALKRQRAELDDHVAGAEAVIAAFAQRREEAKRLAAEEARQRERERGTYFDYDVEHDKDVADMLDKRKRVSCAATNGESTCSLYGDGSWAFTTDLPVGLYNKLKGRALSHPSPTYVALGSNGRYYIEFDNGSSQWHMGCDSDLEADLREGGVATVAFGGVHDSYFVVRNSGSWSCWNVPQGLTDLIEERGCAAETADLVAVSLGPDGEWWLKARNGRTWWGGTSTQLDRCLQKYGRRGSVTFVDFGRDDTYLVRYTE